ncbi:uncharacterized protein LOC119685572 [Teleopsis dalmanni]|uniref:uncharacterized protein LOC119685572 n=1 Tax=Teleopsis dalmanni TaxID=139649 RepID=UPI0018CE7336|nr:uncharacterized protein LOC119685572 [Teleopsis dalmanni]
MFQLTRHLKIPLSVVSKLGLSLMDRKPIIAPLVCNMHSLLLSPSFGTSSCSTKPPKRLKSCKKQKCEKVDKPPCKPKYDAAKKFKCKTLEDHKPPPKKSKKKKIKSMWLNPPCCIVQCVMPDRSDVHYYRPINYLKRKYKKTWISCQRVPPKPRCLPVKFIYPTPKRRTFKRKKGAKKSGCDRELTKFAETLMPCRKPKSKAKCPKITLEGCRGVRVPPRCFKTRVPLDCEKVYCPWPSFSECDHPKLRELPPSECLCLSGASLCILYRYLNAMSNAKH